MEFNLLLNRINELSKIAKSRELTQEEKDERAELRKEYISIFRGNLKIHLDNIEIVDKDKIN